MQEEALSLDEVRSQLEKAMGTGPIDEWLEIACARLLAHRRLGERQRVYDVSTVGARIRTAREVVGYTQRQLAHRCGIWPPEMHAIERGRRDLEARFIPRLANALGVSIPWMLMESDEGGPAIPDHLQRKLKRVGWNHEPSLKKKRAQARAELERMRGLRPPRATERRDVDGEPAAGEPPP